MKAENRQYPWLPVSLLITGLIIGYGIVSVQTQPAEAYGECPTPHVMQ